MTSRVQESLDWTGDVTTLGMINMTASDVHNNASNCSVNCSSEVKVNESADAEYVIRIVIPIVFGVIFLLGLFGNALVILVVVFDKNMRSTTNVLILSLAMADLLFIVICVPFTATMYVLPVWPFGRVWCKVVQYLIYVCAYASVYTLVLMSLDRYLAVVHAIRSINIRTERNTWLAVGATWIIITACNVPILLEYDVFRYTHDGDARSVCTNVHQHKHKEMGVIFYACFITFGYILPLGATCLMYGLMLKRLHGAAPGGKTNKSQESLRAKRRVTKMVVVIVVVFAVCWLPIQVILLLQKTGVYPISIPFVGLQVACNSLAYMNSCVNPIFYAFLSENFRRSFRKFLCCSSPVSRRSEYELVSVKQSEGMTQATAITSSI